MAKEAEPTGRKEQAEGQGNDKKAAVDQLKDKAAGAKSKVGEKAQELIGDLDEMTHEEREATRRILSELRTKLDAGKEAAREKLHHLRERAAESYETATHKAHDLHERVGDTSLKDVERSVGEYIKEKPGKSLLIAAAVGFAAGILFRGRG